MGKDESYVFIPLILPKTDTLQGGDGLGVKHIETPLLRWSSTR